MTTCPVCSRLVKPAKEARWQGHCTRDCYRKRPGLTRRQAANVAGYRTLVQRQSLPLEAKVAMSIRRIREWYAYWDGAVYVAFSGGKDSTVLLHLVRSIYPEVPAVFINTTMEYPEIRRFATTHENVVSVHPKKSFHRVVVEHGWPVISKEQAKYIFQYRNGSALMRRRRWEGYGPERSYRIANKWRFLVDAPFKISNYCCAVLKKAPSQIYDKRTGRKPMLGMLAEDSKLRKALYVMHGCSTFTGKKPKSTPLGFWTTEDVWAYIRSRRVPYCSLYDHGVKSTGCMLCLFGVHMESPNRIQLLKESHPKIWRWGMNELGLRAVMEYINLPCELKREP